MRHCQPGSRAVARVSRKRFGARAGDRHRPVARQPPAPVVVSSLERLLDEKAAEAGAVDEEVGGNSAALFQGDRCNVAVVGLADINDPSLCAHDAVLLGERAEVFCV